jgi:hypothetical protein
VVEALCAAARRAVRPRLRRGRAGGRTLSNSVIPSRSYIGTPEA